jgi:hypothetical protein
MISRAAADRRSPQLATASANTAQRPFLARPNFQPPKKWKKIARILATSSPTVSLRLDDYYSFPARDYSSTTAWATVAPREKKFPARGEIGSEFPRLIRCIADDEPVA